MKGAKEENTVLFAAAEPGAAFMSAGIRAAFKKGAFPSF
jgi:hypothetical protein